METDVKERASKRLRVEELAAHTVAIRVAAIMESRKENDPSVPVRVAVSRKTVSTNPRQRLLDLGELVAFHNHKNGRSGSAETRAGAPYWKVVAYVGPVTKGATELKGQILALFKKCGNSSSSGAATGSNNNNVKEDGNQGSDETTAVAAALVAEKHKTPTALLLRCAESVAARQNVGFVDMRPRSA